MLSDVKVFSTKLESIDQYSELLRTKLLVPVGTVEFVREAMKLAGIKEPPNITYPETLKRFLKRSIRLTNLNNLKDLKGKFIKPVETKLFTGFVYDGSNLNQPESLLIWESEVVQWISEYRVYVLNKEILGYARYDSNEEESCFELELVNEMIKEFNDSPKAYTLDVGVLSNGETALVEVNDAWAIGLYRGAISARDYANFLNTRWLELGVETGDYNRNYPIQGGK